MPEDHRDATWVNELVQFLRAQPEISAVRVDPVSHKVSLATMGPVDVASLEAKLAATIAAAESPDPAKAVAQMVSTIVWRILLFYISSLTLIVCIIPWDSIPPAASPFTLALDAVHVGQAAVVRDVGGLAGPGRHRAGSGHHANRRRVGHGGLSRVPIVE